MTTLEEALDQVIESAGDLSQMDLAVATGYTRIVGERFQVKSILSKFGIRIRILRLERGLGQFELAELVGLSEGQISNIERGKSWTGELSFALLLAKALRVTQQSLFDYRQNDAFIKSGGLKRRATRKPAKLIVTRKRKVIVQIPKKKR